MSSASLSSTAECDPQITGISFVCFVARDRGEIVSHAIIFTNCILSSSQKNRSVHARNKKSGCTNFKKVTVLETRYQTLPVREACLSLDYFICCEVFAIIIFVRF